MTTRIIAAALLLASLAPTARADRNDPGSLLIFPEVDNRPGSITIITVTNVRSGGDDIRVHFNYIDQEDCSKDDAITRLTPRDTFSAISYAHAPSHQRGYCFAYALGQTGGPIDADYLIGSVLILDGVNKAEYSMNALVFEAQTGDGNPTDLDFDGIRDLNGLEYSMAPDRIAIPRFIGQDQQHPMASIRAELILIGLTGGRQFHTAVDFLIYNDNEVPFSSAYTFDCWTRVPLLQISGAFGRQFLLTTDNDDDEVVGMPGWESGWIEIDGGVAWSSAASFNDPAVLAVLVELDRLSSASLPFTLGSQSNGDLLPFSIFGDNN
ncbi:MAG: hypothetical protein H6831_06705 [Planctomycetes bacterium]|nr:hypothetical protein [Planctomycetota bacterium]MCB9904080.1 hypothetical protein [Planctomycetota bacterium]